MNMMTPTANKSAFRPKYPYFDIFSISGARYPFVPQSRKSTPSREAKPKSAIFRMKFLPRRMFCNFRSP